MAIAILPGNWQKLDQNNFAPYTMNNEQKLGTGLVLKNHRHEHMSPDGFEVWHEAIHKQYAHLQRQMCGIQGSTKHHSNMDIGRTAHCVEGNHVGLTPMIPCMVACE